MDIRNGSRSGWMMIRRISCLMMLCLAVTTIVRANDDPAKRTDDPKLRHRPRYTLRAGDVLELQYRYTPEFNQTITVLPDGYLNVKLIGDVKVADLTVAQAHDLIVEKLQSRLNDPELNIVLKEFQQPYVVVAGEVPKPGKLDMRENMTAMQAVLLAGGFKDSAQMGQVLLFRKINDDTAEIKQLNLSKLKKASDLERDAQLEAGDMIFVPRDKIEKLSRYIKLLNIGMYFNPLQFIP
jgi:polysaccharide biosynthesis/export protein